MENDTPKTRLEQLESYLDRTLSPSEEALLKEELKSTPKLQLELEALKLSRKAIKNQKIVDQVSRIHHEKMEERRAKTGDAKVVALKNHRFGWITKVAAGFLIALSGYGLYQYSTTSSQNWYDEHYVSYQMPITRSQQNVYTTIDSLYIVKNFLQVTHTFEQLPDRSPRDFFLTSVSHMHLKQYEQAIPIFLQLEEKNKDLETPYFVDELDYYLGLCYVQTKQISEAQQRFKKIKNDPTHMYHNNITNNDMMRLKIIEWK